MPSQQEVRWSQLKVGILVIVALITLTALIFLMTGTTGGIFSHKLTLRSYFENSAGLKVGAPVQLEGVTIGNVKKIRIASGRKLTPVEVVMRVGAEYRDALHTDSKSSLVTIGVLGDTVVDISSTKATGPPVQQNGELPTTESPSLSDVIKSGQGTIEQLNVILTKLNTLADTLNSSQGSVGELINDPELYNKALQTVTQLQALANEVSNGKGSIGKLLADDTLYNRVNDAAGKLDRIATQVDAGKGTIGKLLRDETLADNLNRTVANANQLLARINAGEGGLGVLAKDPRFAARLRDSMTRIDSLLSRIDRGEGTIGQLVRNPSVYNNTDQMLTETRGLISGIREDPKKYLTFRVRVF